MSNKHEISREEVLHMAELSRLFISADELEQFRQQFTGILGHMDSLALVNTENIEPLYTPVQQDSSERDDIVDNKRSREEILANAPETDGVYFIVPRIV